jgi:predicted protein tyrosine phosphatase
LSVSPDAIKLLFICSRNRRRSLTAEKIFAGIPGYEVRSAGTQPAARVVVTAGHIGWADLIVVMEKRHAQQVRDKFPEATSNKRIIALHLRDDYEFMQPELIDELQARLAPFIGSEPSALPLPTHP